jgi:peptidoglycan/LPS O-acetylase OafA/YrhL
LPVTVAIPVSLALLCKSRSADQYYDDFFTAKADGWLEAYWTTICVTILYLIVVLIYVLWELHDDSRQRWLSYMYMIAACIAGAGCMVRIVTVSYDPDPQVSWLFGSLSVIVFACGSGYSWLRKMRQFGEPFNPQEWSTQREELGPDAFHQHRREDNPDEPRQMNDP